MKAIAIFSILNILLSEVLIFEINNKNKAAPKMQHKKIITLQEYKYIPKIGDP
ncbi:hypothetical protein [Winogradskyella sp.]|uniref:hypothetical protein n=1 Tax=Winogradskyella sp. TaxID=1883156 RepID=UPI0025FA81C0|nr:hypothetical protein [Winogradskyella sp.]